MPRTAKRTQTGVSAQPSAAIPGQTYGVGPEQQALQEAMPAPDVRAQPPSLPASPAAPALPAQPPADPMAIARAMQLDGGLLTPGTARPAEPITHGLSTGPGAGPEVLGTRRTNATGDTLRMLTARTGDPQWEQLARRVGI